MVNDRYIKVLEAVFSEMLRLNLLRRLEWIKWAKGGV